MGFRFDFYSHLLDEVKEFSFDLPETSSLPFLAEQLKENKTFSPDSAVSRLRTLDESYDDGMIDEEGYFVGLLDLALQKKIRIQESVFQQILRCRDLFPYQDEKQHEKLHSGIDDEKTYRLYYQQTKEILLSMRKQDHKPFTKTEEPIRKLSQMFMYEALVKEAKDFLYDVGFSVNSKEISRPRKIDRSIQMVDSFFEKEDTAYFLQGYDPRRNIDGSPDKEKILETEKLFSLLDRNADYDSVVIPVVIDPETGAGLYIYGMESDDDPVYLNNEVIARRAKNGHHCFYTIFEYWGSQRNTDDSYYAPGRLIYRQYISNEGGKFESTGYINLEDAIHDYKKVINERVNDMYMYNVPMPAECPERFRKYFFKDEEDDISLKDKERLDSYLKEEKAAIDKKKIVKDHGFVRY